MISVLHTAEEGSVTNCYTIKQKTEFISLPIQEIQLEFGSQIAIQLSFN